MPGFGGITNRPNVVAVKAKIWFNRWSSMLMSTVPKRSSFFHKLQDFQNQVRFPGTELDFQQLWTNLPACSMPQSGAAFSTCALDAWAGMFAGALELCSRASPKHCARANEKWLTLPPTHHPNWWYSEWYSDFFKNTAHNSETSIT